MNPFVQAKKYFVQITEISEMHRKIYYREFYCNMNIIKMFMNNIIILLLAVMIAKFRTIEVRISEDALYVT